jgi:hypothetical protein
MFWEMVSVFGPVLVALITALIAWAKMQKAKTEKEAAGWAETVLPEVLPAAVAAAEQALGSGTGELKMASVIETALNLAPDKYKGHPQNPCQTLLKVI